MEREGDGDINCGWCTCNYPQGLREVIGGTGNQRKNRHYPDNSIVEIGQKYSKGSRKSDENWCRSNSIETSPTNTGVKNPPEVK